MWRIPHVVPFIISGPALDYEHLGNLSRFELQTIDASEMNADFHNVASYYHAGPTKPSLIAAAQTLHETPPEYTGHTPCLCGGQPMDV